MLSLMCSLVSTRPFLSLVEKKWIAYQLLVGLEQAHRLGICHGDIKCENVLCTSWNWIFLADFAPWKPTFIPQVNHFAAYDWLLLVLVAVRIIIHVVAYFFSTRMILQTFPSISIRVDVVHATSLQNALSRTLRLLIRRSQRPWIYSLLGACAFCVCHHSVLIMLIRYATAQLRYCGALP